jgi:hypothetical protein
MAEYKNQYENDLQSIITDQENYNKFVAEMKANDSGYNKVYRSVYNPKKQKNSRTKIEVYSSNGKGAYIRDAITGENFYYTNPEEHVDDECKKMYYYKVGSLDENLFFSVILATGECKSKNNSSTLFFLSPKACMDHLHMDISEEQIQHWEEKRDFRVAQWKQRYALSKKRDVVVR